MMRPKRFLLLIVVAALAVGGFWLYRGRAASGANKSADKGLSQTVEVRQGNLSSNITVVGELDAVQRQDLSFSRMNGTAALLRLDVKPGNTVQAAQALASIDAAPYQQALDQAKSSLQSAEQKLADLKTPASKLDIAKADLAVVKAQLQLQEGQDTLDSLVQPDILALQSTVADAQRALGQAQVDLATLQADKTVDTNLTKLLDTEAKASAQYSRLANETTPDSDASYHDRLQIAFNALKTAEDARITAETQRQADLLTAQITINKAKKTLEDAQTALTTAQAGGDKLALAKAQVAVQDADVALAVARDARSALDKGSDAATVAAAQAEVDKTRLAVSDAEATLTATKLVAPFDGTILQTNVAAGNLVGASTAILTVANMKVLQVLASVDETTIRRVSAGQDVQITFDALAGQVFRGKVVSVPLQGTLQGNVMVYEVPISLAGAENAPLLVGMTANVQIQVGQATNALLVPALALQQVGGKYQVLVPNSDDPQGQPKVVPVEIGLSDGVNTQIVSGLKKGDKVVVQYQTTSSNNNNPGLFGTGGNAIPVQGGDQRPPQPAGR